MTETLEQVETRKSSLDHIAQGAVMRQQDGWSVPASYGEWSAEYAAVREHGPGLIDLSPRGRLLVSGTEAIAFLNGLITNDMKTLGENCWMPAAFPNVQGRLMASVRVVRLNDEASAVPTFLLDTEPVTGAVVLSMLARYTLAGDFRVQDLSEQMPLLSLQGRGAVQLVREVLGDAFAAIGHDQARQGEWSGKEVIAIRASHTGEDGFDLFVNVIDARSLWDALAKAGARPVGYDVFETLRIEAGQPRYGIDMDATNVVSETNLDDAVSFTKGCYIGQEIIARIKYRGHVAKKLTGLKFESEIKVEAGAKLFSADDKEIGRLTSVTVSPLLKSTVALAYVKYDYLSPGTLVKVVSGEHEAQAVVSELPFVRGSWFDREGIVDG